MSLSKEQQAAISTPLSKRQEFRRLVRARRNAISVSEQRKFSHQLTQHVKSLIHQTNTHHQKINKVALYLATDGELDTQPLIHWLWQQNIETYLPVIHPFSQGHLLFLHYSSQTSLVKNRYGIDEPKLDIRALCPVAQIDIIFTPLVAFDQQGQRLGMGGGYYDRTLAPWQRGAQCSQGIQATQGIQTTQGPKAIGLAHNCQQVESLPTEAWDIPLNTIVTPDKIWHW